MTRSIVVTIHACERYAQRGRLERRDIPGIASEIEKEVRLALKGGRIQNHKPENYRLFGEKKNRPLAEPELFVYREDKSMGWIVKKFPESYVVVTTLSPTWATKEQVA